MPTFSLFCCTRRAAAETQKGPDFSARPWLYGYRCCGLAIAITAAAAPALSAVAAAATAAALAVARNHRSRLVHHYGPAHEIPPVAGLDGMVRAGLILNLDEPKPARSAAEAIAHNVHTVYRHAGLCEETLHVGFGGGIGKISYE